MKRPMLSLVSAVGHWVKSRPSLAYAIKPYLKRHPRLWEGLKRVVLFGTAGTGAAETNFIDISFEKFVVHFARGPLDDRRGIGRVARHLLEELTAKAGAFPREQARPEVYFFASVHWCPQVLPHPCVVMVHDIIPLLYPEHFSAPAVEWNTRYRPIIEQADILLAISQTTALDLVQRLSVPSEKIRVIHNGVTAIAVADSPSVDLPNAPFFVYLGSYDIHKNLDVVLKALRRPGLEDIHLVLIGDNLGAKPLAAECGLESRAHFLGRLPDGDVGYVLSSSVGLVFPSLYEGFGLPPLEAGMLGIPCVSSRRPAMTEVLDGAAIYAAPDDSEEWAKAMRLLVDRPDERAALAQAARCNAGRYTWKQCGQDTWSLLSALASQQLRSTPS